MVGGDGGERVAVTATRRRPSLARYLMRHAGPLPKTAPSTIAQQLAAQTSDRETAHGNREYERSLAEMRRIWQAARGYFPGHDMPVPRFQRYGAEGAVGWVKNPQGQNVPVGIRVSRDISRGLTSRHPVLRDAALRGLLHEWAHNFQRPDLYATAPYRRGVQPVIEGGADAFSYAVAPNIARAIGRSYSRRGAIPSMGVEDYRRFTRGVTRRRGMDWILRGQFQ